MKKLMFFAMTLFAVFASAALYAQTPEEFITQYNEAGALMQKKDYAAAAAAFEKAIATGLDAGDEVVETVRQAQKYLVVCYYQLGGRAFQAKDYDNAIKNFQLAADKGEMSDPATAQKAKTFIGRAYTAQGGEAFNNKDYATAASIFAKGYEADPNNTALGLNLAMSYCELGDLEKGSEVYKSIIALKDRHSKYEEDATTATNKLCEYYVAEGAKKGSEKDYEGALAIIEQAMEVDPTNAGVQMLRLQTYNNMKNYDKVAEIGEEVVAAQPDEVAKSNAYFFIGAAYTNKQMKDKAIASFRKVTAGDMVAEAKTQIAALSK